jgi:uncharacterized cupredoxin-like copper-binding protein
MRRVLAVLTLAALGVAGLLAGVLAGQGGAAPAAAAKTVTINVTIGKPSEFRFTLSKRSVPVGTTVVFKVVNKGKSAHDFKINGKKTKLLQPGKSATLRMKFTKKKKYPYICTVLGNAQLGMKGTFSVGSKPVPITTTTSTTSTTSTTTTTVVGPATTVNVNMTEYKFDFTPAGGSTTTGALTVPQGTVTFVIRNSGNEVHNLNILGIHVGALLSPGQTETWTVGMARNTYNALCDVPFHSDRGMVAQVTVT